MGLAVKLLLCRVDCVWSAASAAMHGPAVKAGTIALIARQFVMEKLLKCIAAHRYFIWKRQLATVYCSGSARVKCLLRIILGNVT